MRRVLRAKFLRLILTRAEFSGAMAKPEGGIRCARGEGMLDFSYADVAPRVLLIPSYFSDGVPCAALWGPA